MSATPDERFIEYVQRLRSTVTERSIEHASDDEDALGRSAFREDAFTAVVVDALEDLGQLAGSEICYFERRFGRALGKVNGWWIDEDSGELDLLTTIYRGDLDLTRVGQSDVSQALTRALRVYEAACEGRHEEMEPASPSHDLMQRVHELGRAIERIRVIVVVDGIVGDVGNVSSSVPGAEVRVDVWDLQRLYRADSSGLPYEPVAINLAERWGCPLPCLRMPRTGSDYTCYLVIFPGELLCQLYHDFGARLLELNVRSFLQARGKVNKGIRDTLRREPTRFMAYNNGISATAESIELSPGVDGGLAIEGVVGLQIVNGGQTVASIHRAGTQDKVDLSDVFVQAKITLVRPEHIETLVPLVSRYANTQNRVNEADFSANHPFHVTMQKLADTTWAPGEETRWFYERARGQYQVAKAREGATPAKKRAFELATPPRQRFDKVDLAKFLNSWDQLPHLVSRGGQKNFVAFMERLARSSGAAWEPDAAFYRASIGKGIIFKAAEKVARAHAFPSYRANAITYTVALLSYRTAGRIDLDSVWSSQAVSEAISDTLHQWMPLVHEAIILSAGTRNVTEWCKKEECWRHIQTLPVRVSHALEAELAIGQPLPTVGSEIGRRGDGLTEDDRENIARVMQVAAEDWIYIAGWGAQSGHLQEWQCGIATTLAGYAAGRWNKVPSKKQAAQGVAILGIANQHGGSPVEELADLPS